MSPFGAAGRGSRRARVDDVDAPRSCGIAAADDVGRRLELDAPGLDAGCNQRVARGDRPGLGELDVGGLVALGADIAAERDGIGRLALEAPGLLLERLLRARIELGAALGEQQRAAYDCLGARAACCCTRTSSSTCGCAGTCTSTSTSTGASACGPSPATLARALVRR